MDNDREMKNLKRHFLPYIKCSTCKNQKYKKKYEIRRPGSATGRRRSTTYVVRVRPSSAPLHRSGTEYKAVWPIFGDFRLFPVAVGVVRLFPIVSGYFRDI